MNIQQIKEQYTCLDWLGDKVVRKTAGGYLCRCPWREDVHPSLTVTPNGKGWYDHSTGKHGNLIEMVMLCLGTNDLSRVCAVFDTITPFSFHQSRVFNELKEKGNGFAFLDIVPLQSEGLFDYLTERCINTSIARQFLQEAHYSFQKREDGRYLFALAYANDLGGYELRSSSFKGGTAPKGITTHLGRKNAPTVVFEGFFDMLSFATLCGEVRHNYVVLNSVVNADAGIVALRSIGGRVLLCLDNDKGGDVATAKMLEALPETEDIRNRFAPFNDVNDYLVYNVL